MLNKYAKSILQIPETLIVWKDSFGVWTKTDIMFYV